MKVLISPNENVLNPNTNAVIGARICDIVETPFEVAQPLFWVDYQDGVLSSTHYYNLDLNTFAVIPEHISNVSAESQPTTQGAQNL